MEKKNNNNSFNHLLVIAAIPQRGIVHARSVFVNIGTVISRCCSQPYAMPNW